MTFIDAITPKNTEEVKPGLFIQTIETNPNKFIYRQVKPLAWKGKFRTKEQLATLFSVRTFLTLGIIAFIIWAYFYEVGEYRSFYIDTMNNPIEFCETAYANIQTNPLGNLEVINEQQKLDSNSLSGNT